MSYVVRDRDRHFQNDGRPKRILTLDGGGLRGVLSLAILQKIEDILRERHNGDANFRLCHYFDLIAGTSTGAIIAATLAMGWSVERLYQKYISLGRKVFQKGLLRQGVLRAKYDAGALIRELKTVYKDAVLGGPELQTGLLVVTKRLDTGSPWPISNNPRGQFFSSLPDGTIGNSDYPLWQVVRASTAAPSFFEGEAIDIVDRPGRSPLRGEFVDGGVSPFNNPALQALMYATLEGYRVGWPQGAEQLLLVSVGTGMLDAGAQNSNLAALHAINSLKSLMDDCSVLQETLLQWMAESPTARSIDSELGDLRNDSMASQKLLSYLRYNADLTPTGVAALDPALTDAKLIESLSTMDDPNNMDVLHQLGELAARKIDPNDFPACFDLPAA
ncbi:patatin-like phospholipase family protein [Synechococcus sp. PCC 7336]|uniref:patatin-like phospholipase family protein n=1 Tax=Synechococcus sp. PCC 7336 TaxID=195250 RepID=UPI0003456B50|nr:patatin-like phospholipase family protein [Synechococcus sp. PCC 7336]